jgi:hAT family dimerisation domain.
MHCIIIECQLEQFFSTNIEKNKAILLLLRKHFISSILGIVVLIIFSTLACLAKIYLAIQATSAPSERVFSQASKIINNLRTSLKPEMAGRLLFISKNVDWYYEHISASDIVED